MVIFLSFVQSLDVPSLKDKVRKMIGEDLVVSNFTSKFSNLSDMNLFGPTGHFVFLSGVLLKNNSWIRFVCIYFLIFFIQYSVRKRTLSTDSQD